MNIVFQVYDRWGNQVFGTGDRFTSWDGRYRGSDCEMGTYFYVYKYFCSYNERWYVKSGDINLIR